MSCQGSLVVSSLIIFLLGSTKLTLPSPGIPDVQSLGLRESIQVTGIISSADRDASVVILIQPDSRKTAIAAQGDTVWGVKILRILENKILVELQGRKYELKIGADVSFQGGQEEGPRAGPDENGAAGDSVRLMTLERRPTKTRFRREWRFISRGTRLSPRMIDGIMDGYEITKMLTGTILSDLGLEKNDVIKRLNNIQLDRKVHPLSLIKELMGNDMFELMVERDRALLTFVYFVK
jgi:type II secretory pathway component PulC